MIPAFAKVSRDYVPRSMNTENPLSTPEPNVAKPRSKSAARRLIEDFLVTGCGLATSAGVAYGSYALAKRYDVAVYTWMGNYILPVGATLCGFVAAIGYWIGSRLFHHRPSRLLLLNIVLVSLTTYFSIHDLNYHHEYTRSGLPLEQVMSYPDYLVAVTENMTYKSSRSGDEGTTLGKWGWGVAALQITGFCLGGFLVYGMLTSVPYCDRCSMYYHKLWSRASKWKDVPDMAKAYESVAALLKTGQLQNAVNLHATLGEARKFRVRGFLTMQLRKCPGCERRLLNLTAQRRNGNQFVTVSRMVIPTEEAIQKAAG